MLLLGLVVACEPGPMYENYLLVESVGWHQDSTASFQVEITDTNAPYMVIFNLRANDAYPYSNLYLFREIRSEEGLEYRDTAEVTLADAYGRWLGEGIGELKTYSRPYRAQPLRFNRKGTYTFTFTQAMRTAQLPGVEAVGLTLYKEENGKEENN